MNIGIVGAGFIGRAVAALAIEHGHAVTISNSRGPRTLLSTAASLGCGVGTVAQAVAAADLVLLAIPFWAVPDLDPAPFAGRIVMDANNYYPLRDEANAALDAGTTTTSAIVAAHLPGARIVKAWNAILERDIAADARAPGASDRRALPIAGDDAGAKAAVAAFIDEVGFDPLDAGPLAEGWRFERAQPAYCRRFDRAGLIAALAQAGTATQADGSWRA